MDSSPGPKTLSGIKRGQNLQSKQTKQMHGIPDPNKMFPFLGIEQHFWSTLYSPAGSAAEPIVLVATCSNAARSEMGTRYRHKVYCIACKVPKKV